MLKKENFVLSRENKRLRRGNRQLEQALFELSEIRAREIQVAFNMIEHTQVKIESLEHAIIDLRAALIADKEVKYEPLDTAVTAIKNDLIKVREQLPHFLLAVWKLLSLDSENKLDKRLFDADDESREQYLSQQFQVRLIDARKIWKTFLEWRV